METNFSELEKSDKYWIKELFYSSVRGTDKKTGHPKSVEMEPLDDLKEVLKKVDVLLVDLTNVAIYIIYESTTIYLLI